MYHLHPELVEDGAGGPRLEIKTRTQHPGGGVSNVLRTHRVRTLGRKTAPTTFVFS